MNAANGLRRLLDVSGELLALADADEWDAFTVKEDERMQLMREVFDAMDARVRREPATISAIRELMAFNDQILARALAARGQFTQQFQQVRQGRKADAAYRAAAE